MHTPTLESYEQIKCHVSHLQYWTKNEKSIWCPLEIHLRSPFDRWKTQKAKCRNSQRSEMRICRRSVYNASACCLQWLMRNSQGCSFPKFIVNHSNAWVVTSSIFLPMFSTRNLSLSQNTRYYQIVDTWASRMTPTSDKNSNRTLRWAILASNW